MAVELNDLLAILGGALAMVWSKDLGAILQLARMEFFLKGEEMHRKVLPQAFGPWTV